MRSSTLCAGEFLEKEANPESAELFWTLSVGELLFSFVVGYSSQFTAAFPDFFHVIVVTLLIAFVVSDERSPGSWGLNDARIKMGYNVRDLMEV